MVTSVVNMTGHCSPHTSLQHRLYVRWTNLFRRHKKKKSNKTCDKRIVIQPDLQDSLLDSEFENLSDKLSSLSISQDFISEMREAFCLFDKV